MSDATIPGTEALGLRAGELLEINPAAIKGEAGTGFEKRGSKGKFECGNCEYFDAAAGACDQRDMKLKSKQPRLADGRVSVAFDDCCEYIFRIGRKDSDESKE